MARAERYPGLGARITERMEALGYRKNGRPDVLGLCRDRGLVSSYLYEWLAERSVPSYANLLRLAGALECPPAWLLFGSAESEALVAFLATHGTPAALPPTGTASAPGRRRGRL